MRLSLTKKHKLFYKGSAASHLIEITRYMAPMETTALARLMRLFTITQVSFKIEMDLHSSSTI